jgi:hypothetical protein
MIGRHGATPGRVGTARRVGSGKQDQTASERNQWLEFRSKWAHEALTRENMSSWAHDRTPVPEHSCSSKQIKQSHAHKLRHSG